MGQLFCTGRIVRGTIPTFFFLQRDIIILAEFHETVFLIIVINLAEEADQVPMGATGQAVIGIFLEIIRK